NDRAPGAGAWAVSRVRTRRLAATFHGVRHTRVSTPPPRRGRTASTGESPNAPPGTPVPPRGAGAREGRLEQWETSGGWSLMNWLSNWVSCPIRSLLRPPLPEPAVFSVNVLPLTVAVPKLSMPPPSLVAVLPEKVLSLTVNVLRDA